ncbi:unnamed protein product [Gadus morhua 'NCC']
MEARRSFLWVRLLLLGVAGALAREVCLGTDMKLDLLSSLENHYETLRLLYTGCQVVHGNLEITHLHGVPDLSFLEGIVEVQGYVLVADVTVDLIPLDNLRVIRGSQRYGANYSLVVLNNTKGPQGPGLRTLRMRSLTEILLGGVYMWGNPQLCFPNPQKILWRDTLDQQNTHKHQLTLQASAANCPRCNSVCLEKCWGETIQDCQIETHVDCTAGCLRCKGKHASDCCHKQCAAGCTGPKDSDCLACRYFNNNGVCKEHCPAPTTYVPATYQSIPNKDKKFSFGATCIKTCPHNYLTMEAACTMVCPKANQEMIILNPDGSESQKCDKCEGECPKVCYGLGMGSLQGVTMVTSSNVEQFNSCKKIFGSLAFLSQSFTGDPSSNMSGLTLDQLTPFHNLEEITGYLYIEAWPEEWSDISVFKNLQVIRGRVLFKGVFSLVLQDLNISSVGSRSLRSVSGGLVLIHNNSRLCYTSSLPWDTLLHPSQGPTRILSLNQDPRVCEEQGHVCHPLCKGGCWGPGPQQCVSCSAFERGLECVERCDLYQGPTREYEKDKVCGACHSECRPINGSESCYGPGADQCRECLNFQDGQVCVERCPSGVKEEQHTVWKYSNASGHCLPCLTNCSLSCTLMDERGCPVPTNTGPGTTIAAALGGVVLFLILLALLVFYLRRQQKLRRKATMRRLLQEHELVEPLTPSGALPNQAQMRILKETELKKVRVLGSGAFGTVYKGVWAPDGESVKIPVAIKVLRENTSTKANKEILDEAYVMAGVASPYVCRLLGICLTSTVQLVTQLMPYGCLLDYVRENKDRIGSQFLLNWCVQIAKGMSYLEEVRLVHRDLAARNVLVKNPNHVKITDFGLARLLDIDETEYQADGGKVPIKWMALESILHRKFTHQSDVWSYGVTVWELMTFGAKPYDLIPARDIPDLLEGGERLPQPLICTIEVYMIMVKCWMIDPDSRPRFRELVNEFSLMARDPPRYVVIQNEEQRSLTFPVDSQFFRRLLEEEGPDMKDLLDAEEYLIPQPNMFPRTQGDGVSTAGHSRHHSYRSTDQGLDGEPPIGSACTMYSSMSTLGRGQYPTLPLGASPSNGGWSSQYPTLARSPSSGDPCDSVFLDDATGTPASPGRYRQCDGGCHDDLMETDGPPGAHPPPQHHHHQPHHLHHSLPRRQQGHHPSHASPEYVNQEAREVRPAVPDRPSTLPRKTRRSEPRHLPNGLGPNGLGPGHSVENPEYLVPLGPPAAPSSPAFDNPYYLDLLAGVEGTGVRGEGGGGVRAGERQLNGYATPTVENPEYLGLADTWTGHT